MNLSEEHKSLKPVWLKAAVLGGLWASIEIIIGSFFHNLRLPFAGTILAANATVLMVAFYQMWPEKGLIWRAGLIAALMKSVSPSAIILGPMIGILSEALIMEFFIRFFGNNLVSLSIAGSLSVSSALFQKVGNLLIIYGYNKPVLIAKNFYQYLSGQVNLDRLDPWMVVYIIVGVYVVIGFAAVFLGYKIGRKSSKRNYKSQGFTLGEINSNGYLTVNSEFRFSIALFILHILLIPGGLFLFSILQPVYTVLLVVVYGVFAIIRYQRSLKRLKKPALWIQLLLLTLFASLFAKTDELNNALFNAEGLLIGLEMCLRAVFVVLAFSSFGVELRNPVIKDYLFRKGFDKIYSALGLSFTALPVMIEAMPKPKYFLWHPAESFSNMMLHAREWLGIFEKEKG